jgi:hypothetical protein
MVDEACATGARGVIRRSYPETRRGQLPAMNDDLKLEAGVSITRARKRA